MSAEILKNEFGADQHPDETQLLLALERELSPPELAAVEQHIGTCWECRARYHEIHRGILAFVEYRDRLYLPELESAPHDFSQFSSLLNKASAEDRAPGLLDHIGRLLRSFFGFTSLSLQTRWVTATATIMAVVLLWTQVLSPTTLSASELLTKAAWSQNPSAVAHREVRQKVRVKSGNTEVVREFRWETGAPIPDATWGTDPDRWSAPMTAEGFSQWHDSLSAPKDKVKKAGDRWTLDTVAPAGPIKEASLVVHAGDFHPIEQHIRFSDDRRIDLEEVSFQVIDRIPTPSTAPKVLPAAPPAAIQSQPAAPAIDLDEAELALRYTMYIQRLDEDEDLQISRAADTVVVSGIASSEERLQQLRATLSGLPGVRLSLSEPRLASNGSVPAATPKKAPAAAVPLLEDRLDSAFASVEDRRDFVDSSLSISDSALSNAWALRKLVERYSDDDRGALKPESQAKLDEMMRGHLEQIAASNTKLNGLLDLLPPSRPARIDVPSGFRTGATSLFNLVQRQDSLIAALVAGTQTRDSVATVSESFRSAHEAITRLTGRLNPGGGSTPK